MFIYNFVAINPTLFKIHQSCYPNILFIGGAMKISKESNQFSLYLLLISSQLFSDL